MSGIHDFDFLLGAWSIHNRRRTNPFSPEHEGTWEEFPATHRGEQFLDEKVIIEHFEGILPSGEVRKGMTLRTFDPQDQQWSIRWLDNRNPADFRPLTGFFQESIGLFYQEIESPDGRPLHVRFVWDNITAGTARWQQAFSYDGQNWDTNWIMEFTR